ncbi:hypothetical protein [uncultured Bilophila sp.]|uniref:hypothetical protein n=1 Tax=uncultured Bilophila sp. TaxID=529385 RepID=UPI00266F7A4F|nr:hypothetical protein [uncultured Bilophila sp.]
MSDSSFVYSRYLYGYIKPIGVWVVNKGMSEERRCGRLEVPLATAWRIKVSMQYFMLFEVLPSRANFYSRLRHRKWLMLFPLKFQRDKRQNILAVDSVNGKNG